MNILITAPSLNPEQNVSGVAAVVNTIIDNSQNHHFHHYLLGSPDKSLSKLQWITQFCKQILEFPFVLKRKKIHLVHQNLPFNRKGLIREYIINVWCRLFRIPVVLHIHGGEFLMSDHIAPFYKFLAKKLFTMSNKVLVLSELERSTVSNRYKFDRAEVLSNSIHISQYEPHVRILKEIPTILFLGRIHESKGIDEIILALELLKQNNYRFKFVLCGVGPLQDKIIDKCTEFLGNQFEYMGVVFGAKKLQVISASDIFLLPSRYGEGLPMALLESMASGAVPIVTDDASMKHLVQNNVNGLRVDKYNANDLFLKIQSVLDSSEKIKRLSKNAIGTIADHYDIGPYIMKLDVIYKKAIA